VLFAYVGSTGKNSAMNDTLKLFTDQIATPLGDMFLVTDADENLRAAYWTDETRMTSVLRAHFRGSGFTVEAREKPSSHVAAFHNYFAGDLAAIVQLVVKTAGTVFQREVWQALREIPCGSTISYSTLAQRIGRPAAVRAVGLANGSNPICVVVPCHRVIGADGSLTGYGGGLERKRWLLRHESARVPADRPPLFDAHAASIQI
jgi:methylated-DNA-[protein]-cysteine S-methyltransferase